MKYFFASDVHLGLDIPGHGAAEREQLFCRWLDMVSSQLQSDGGALYLLGDIFDFWFEYRRVVPQGFVRTLGKLAELTDRGIRIGFFPGNHDLWVRDYFRRECGMEVYPMPRILELKGQRIYMAHGDNMGVGREPRLLNRIFRSRTLRWLFSWGVHPDWAVRFGRWWSGRSRKSHHAEGAPTAAMTEPLIEYARNYAATHPEPPIDHFVFGHLHFARDYREAGLHTVHLGCWEETPAYAVLDDTGELTLKRFDR